MPVVPSTSGEPVSPINTRDRVLKPIGRKINMPWLSWQALKRSRQSVMNEVRCRLVDELVLSVGHFRN